MHRWVPKRHHVLLIVWVEEGLLNVWLQSDWITGCVWAISSLQNEAVILCECLLGTESGWRWEVESRNFVLIQIQGKWAGEGIIRSHSQSPSNAKIRQSTLYPMLPDFQKNTAFIRFPSFVRLPFWKEQHVDDEYGHCWNDRHKGKPTYSQKNLSQCHLFHHKSHTNYPPTVPDPPQSKAGD